jgi:hypothetical protein
VRTVRHWWNGAAGGTAGELVRRDVYLRTDGRRWEIEATEVGTRSRSARRTYSTEEEARAVLREWLGDEADWQELPP